MLVLASQNANQFLDIVGQSFGWFLFAVIAVVWIVFAFTASTLKHRARERTRREIAAYVAEGSMTPDEGERLLNAGAATPTC